ncbi:hypothetical protein [Paenibacillus sp. GCM10023250]|uniref:hypothetical protein n=1 Tax=Paenibacillus sp. GCM10023250 TaxID=3252648 RepID=UPI00360DCA25
MTRLKAAVVGATGMAGQQFVQALSQHPNFEVVQCVPATGILRINAVISIINYSWR